MKGKQVRRKLSALELVGPLAIVCGVPDKVRGKALRVHVDNIGSVEIWKKGYSTTCELSSTLVRAIFEVSAALQCHIDLVKITRCSNPGSDMSDALSKAEFVRFREVATRENCELSEHLGTVPQALHDWIRRPTDDWFLGEKILRELSKTTDVIGY